MARVRYATGRDESRVLAQRGGENTAFGAAGTGDPQKTALSRQTTGSRGLAVIFNLNQAQPNSIGAGSRFARHNKGLRSWTLCVTLGQQRVYDAV